MIGLFYLSIFNSTCYYHTICTVPVCDINYPTISFFVNRDFQSFNQIVLICVNEIVSNSVSWWFEFKYLLYCYEWCKNEYWIDWNGLILYCWRISYFGDCSLQNDTKWMKMLIYVSIMWLSPWKCYFLLFYRFQWMVHWIYLLWFQFEYSNIIFSIWRVVVVFTLFQLKEVI